MILLIATNNIFNNLPALPITFKQKLKNLQVEEGHNITLCCEISKPGVHVEWRLGGDLLENGEKYQIKQRESVLELTIREAVPEDSGVYSCVCREQRTKATVKVVGMVNIGCYDVFLKSYLLQCPCGFLFHLFIQYKPCLCLSTAIPATFKVSLKSQEAEEGNVVTLRCELSKKGVTVQWQREGKVLSEEVSRGKYQMKLEGKIAVMTILNAQPDDAGKYSCITGDEKTSAEVKIKRKFDAFEYKHVACVYYVLLLDINNSNINKHNNKKMF